MSDEHERLLQQILDVQREQLAFAKQQREELMAMQRQALAGQNKGLRMSRFVILFMLLLVGAFVALTAIGLSHGGDGQKEFVPGKDAPPRDQAPDAQLTLRTLSEFLDRRPG